MRPMHASGCFPSQLGQIGVSFILLTVQSVRTLSQPREPLRGLAGVATLAVPPAVRTEECEASLRIRSIRFMRKTDIFNNTTRTDCENTRPYRQMKVRFFCIAAPLKADVMQIIFDYCCQERQQHHAVKKERGKKKNKTMMKLHVCFKGSSQDKGLEL